MDRETLKITFFVTTFIVLLVVAIAWFTASAERAIKKNEAKQKQDYFECLSRAGIGVDGQSWCYDKFIK